MHGKESPDTAAWLKKRGRKKIEGKGIWSKIQFGEARAAAGPRPAPPVTLTVNTTGDKSAPVRRGGAWWGVVGAARTGADVTCRESSGVLN